MIDHFVDATPADDDEFALLADDVLHARSKDASEDHVDLLTVVFMSWDIWQVWPTRQRPTAICS